MRTWRSRGRSAVPCPAVAQSQRLAGTGNNAVYAGGGGFRTLRRLPVNRGCGRRGGAMCRHCQHLVGNATASCSSGSLLAPMVSWSADDCSSCTPPAPVSVEVDEPHAHLRCSSKPTWAEWLFGCGLAACVCSGARPSSRNLLADPSRHVSRYAQPSSRVRSARRHFRRGTFPIDLS